MAIIHSKFVRYIATMLTQSLESASPAFWYDPILHLANQCLHTRIPQIDFAAPQSFSSKDIQVAAAASSNKGLIGICECYFAGSILNQFVDIETERKIIALKTGYPHLPATTEAIIMKGLGYPLKTSEVLSIFASHGLTRGMKKLAQHFDFTDVNRRASRLEYLLKKSGASPELDIIQKRYLAMRAYIVAETGKKEKAIRESGLKRSLFFYYWGSFKKLGLLGLIDKGAEGFRNSKIGMGAEARLVIDRIQHPDRRESFYVDRLKSMDIKIDRSAVSKLFSRWNIGQWHSEFVSNLDRLQKTPSWKENDNDPIKTSTIKPCRMADLNFVRQLSGLDANGLYVDGPGIPILWAYLEELGIFPVLEAIGLTRSEKKRAYTWFDLFLLDVVRRFYGISTHSRACEHEEPTLAFFCHLLTLPCNDTFLGGLRQINSDQVFQLRQWLSLRMKELKLIRGRKLGFDFHQIDLDVQFEKLREFGRGPSPKKKTCHDGFRPHIAWDLESNTLIAVEFRKASARGTTTVQRFAGDYILPHFKDLFEIVYIDSEYTGKAVWNFILDPKMGMGAQLTACLKQNAMVRKQRDKFLLQYKADENFWRYYDDHHVYSSKTFSLTWTYTCEDSNNEKQLSLNCVVKKAVKDGKLRCFGTSKIDQKPIEILEDYSHRWIIENGIKDLVYSYYLDKCPGTDPHSVDIHFFVVSICRCLYRMIERDLGDFVKNPDGSTKSLQTMREVLFRQGNGRIHFRDDRIDVKLLDTYTPKLTNQLRHWFNLVCEKHENGLDILGGLKLSFSLNPPTGEEFRNAMKTVPLASVKNLCPTEK